MRPTASKIRQAFFNILSNISDEARFVDVCAGSGLMGLEALSRGASSLIAIEENGRMAKAIAGNIKKFGFAERAEVITADVRRALPLLSPGEADIIFADPPYKAGLAEPILAAVDESELLSPEGVLAIETAADQRLPEETAKLEQYDRRKYGQTAITFYRRK